MHRILVVDDDKDTAQTFVELLLSMGHEANYVCRALDALPVAIAFVPDVVLLDLTMPVMDGYESAKALRALPQFEAVRLVAVSGHDGPEDRMRSRNAGLDALVGKPADIALLESILAHFD